MAGKNDIVLPDTLYNLLLLPIAKRLKVRYIPKSSKALAKSIFSAIAQKAEDRTNEIEPYRENLEKIVSVAGKYIELFSTLLKPLITAIPPQYLIVIVAIVLGFTVIFPARIAGILLWYQGEQWLKVPIIEKSKSDIDKIPKVILSRRYIFDTITQRTITTTYKRFFQLSRYQQDAYFYEANAGLKARLFAIKTILEKFPETEYISLSDLNLPLADSLPGIDLNEKITLTATFYSGKKRLLPPILTSIVEGIKNIYFNRIQDLDSKFSKIRDLSDRLFTNFLDGALGYQDV